MIKAASIELVPRPDGTNRSQDQEHRAYREAHGSCSETDAYGRQQSPCYTSGEPDEWCEVCAGSIPTYQRRKAASTRVAAAMHRLMALCRKATVNYQEAA